MVPLLCPASGAAQKAEPADGAHGRVGSFRRDDAFAAHDVAEAEHLLLLHEREERRVALHLGHDEVERVAPEVEGGDAHGVERRPVRRVTRLLL